MSFFLKFSKLHLIMCVCVRLCTCVYISAFSTAHLGSQTTCSSLLHGTANRSNSSGQAWQEVPLSVVPFASYEYAHLRENIKHTHT